MLRELKTKEEEEEQVSFLFPLPVGYHCRAVRLENLNNRKHMADAHHHHHHLTKRTFKRTKRERERVEETDHFFYCSRVHGEWSAHKEI